MIQASAKPVTNILDWNNQLAQYRAGTGYAPSIITRTSGQQTSAPTGGNNIPTNNIQTQNNQPQYDALKSQQDAINAQLEADYGQAMSSLDQQQSGLQGQADTATSQITNDAAGIQTDLGAQQSTQENGVNSSLSTAEKQGTSAMQQARDVYRQTQQQNTSQLSALGISSSSVSEALAERLGVDVAKRIAGVTGSVQEVRQNAVNELGRIKNYYTEKKTQLDQNVALQKQSIQQALMQGLQQINAARNQAASDKAAKRAGLLSQVSSAIASLTQQQQQFDQSLQQWTAQKSAALQPIAQDPNYLQKIIDTSNNLNKQFSTSGFTFTPQVNYDKYGNITGQVSSNKQPTDQFGNPIQSTPTGQITSSQNSGQPDYTTYPHDGYTY